MQTSRGVSKNFRKFMDLWSEVDPGKVPDEKCDKQCDPMVGA
jgi:hypothetical protein